MKTIIIEDLNIKIKNLGNNTKDSFILLKKFISSFIKIK